MSWSEVSGAEILELFSVAVNFDPAEADVYIQKYKGFMPDPHPAADRFIKMDPTEQESARQEYRAALEAKRLHAIANPYIKPVRKTVRDRTTGRRLEAKSGKLDPATRKKVIELFQLFSQRGVALKLGLSRATVARALGKSWANDKRVGRKR